MSYVSMMAHCVWGTKNRTNILEPAKRIALFQHILDHGREKNIYVDTINGHADHVHVLVSLGADQSIAKVVQLMKGESSHWANTNNVFSFPLEWSEDYFAASVSQSSLEKVREYIRNQEEHHRTMTFAEEYKKFVERYGFQLG